MRTSDIDNQPPRAALLRPGLRGLALAAAVCPVVLASACASRAPLRAAGPDLVATVASASRVFLATSLTDWPGWVAESAGEKIPLVTTNHAFVGLWLDAGRRTVRLHYRPESFLHGLAAFAFGLAAAAVLGFRRRGSSG